MLVCQDWDRYGIPYVIQEVDTTRACFLMQWGGEAWFVSKHPDLLVESLCEEFDHVLEVAIACNEDKLFELIAKSDFHGFHDYGDVDFLLNLNLEGFLWVRAIFIRAPHLLLLEAPNVHANRVLLQPIIQSALPLHYTLRVLLSRHKMPLWKNKPCAIFEEVDQLPNGFFGA